MNSALMRWLLDIDQIPADASNLHWTLERPFPGWVWLLLLISAGLFAFWSYSRLSGSRMLRGPLAVVRFLLIAAVLFLVAGPALEHPRETVEEDWVLMLVDRSRSMEVADAGEMKVGTSGESRDQQLQNLLEQNAPMWQEMADNRHVVWLGFHGGAFNLAAPARNDETTIDESGDDTVPLPFILDAPTGEQTSLSTALGQALQQAAARPVSGVVVFSDGRTTDPPDRALMRRLHADAIPIFTVPLGSPDAIGDLSIRRVAAPRRAFVRDKVPVTVELDRLGGLGDSDLSVVLIDQLSGEELDRVVVPAGSQTDEVTLTAQPIAAGTTSWQVRLESNELDLIPENNLKPFVIELIDRALRVLYVDGYPRWEYRYLKNLLIREKSIEGSVMLLSADRDFAQEGNVPITRLPRSPEEFAQYDVIVIGDVPAGFFAREQLEHVRRQVAERGTGILWLGGERAMPKSYTGTAWADLLPMRGPLALSTIGAPVNMEPTDLADRLGVLQLVIDGETGWPDDLVDPAQGWSQLYWSQRIEPGRLKPTAEVLAETTATIDGVQLPLIMHMRYGAGQTMYVATDEIWRWRYGRGEALPEQFWIQMIRMLGRESLVSDGDRALLDAKPYRVATDQPVRFELRLLDAQLADSRRSDIGAVVETAAGERIAEIRLKRIDHDDERYAWTFLPRVTGELRVRLDDPGMMGLDIEAPFEVYAPDDELRQPQTDHALLTDLSLSTGGAVLDPDDLAELTGLLRDRSVRTPNPLVERIWDTPLFFGLIVLLITVEWIGRKLVRLP